MHEARWLVVALVSIGAWGCGMGQYDRASGLWDSWIGSTKDHRVKDLGIPTRCHTFQSKGEVCEWPIQWAPDASGNITIQFDGKGLVCEWTYRDAYEMRRSESHCP